MSPGARGEAGDTVGGAGSQRLDAELQLAREGGGLTETLLVEQARPVVAQALLRQRSEGARELLGSGQGLTGRDYPVDQTDPLGLLRPDRSAGEHQVEGAAERR